MKDKKFLKKVIAILLIFTLNFANWAIVTKTYASSFVDALLGETSDTGSKNVKFEAYFEDGEEKTPSISSDVKNKELKMRLELEVQNEGYLKNAKIEIKEAKEGNGINFKVREFEELPEIIQSFEDNILSIKQIDKAEEVVKIELPIEYENEELFDVENISKDFNVVLTGTYVGIKGNEKEISKEVELNVTWEDEREIKIETNVEKYIDLEEAVVVQTKVIVDSTTEENTLPVKSTEVVIEVPTYKDVHPSNINVIANSTLGTNGKAEGEVEFVDWEYDEELNVIRIKTENEVQFIEIEKEQEVIVEDLEAEIVEVENEELNEIEEVDETFDYEEIEQEVETEEVARFYNETGKDEYLITYTYKEVEISEEALVVNSNIEGKIIPINGIETIESAEVEYNLDEKTGNIVSLKRSTIQEPISKINLYTNINEEQEEINLEFKNQINISSNVEMIEEICVEDENNFYINKDESKIETNDIYYKKIEVLNFDEILGEEGQIRVLDEEENEIAVLNYEDEEKIVEFEDRCEKIKLEISKPVAEGNLVVVEKKAISEISLNKEQISQALKIESSSKVEVRYSGVEEFANVTDEESNKAEIVLVDTETMATLTLPNNTISTLEENNEIQLNVDLNNGSERSDLYGKTELEIEFPECVENLELNNSSMLYNAGLRISDARVDDRKVIVSIDGKQTSINKEITENLEVKGTIINLNLNVKVNMYTPLKQEKIIMRVTNEDATNYNNEGMAEALLNISAPAGVIAVSNLKGYKEEKTLTSITSKENEIKTDLIDVHSENTVDVTSEIIVMNNNENKISNFSILGRVPFEGVRDILNDDNLGTTVNTKMKSEILADEKNGSEFIVFYSEKEDANKDLEDAENGWTQVPENFENIKSYLIVPQEENYEMEASSILKFSFVYEIPNDLPHNENIFGTYVVYYRNLSELVQSNCTAIPELIGLTTGAGPEIKLEVNSDKTELKEYEIFDVTVDATNVGDCPAEDVKVILEDRPINTILVDYEIENGEANWIEFEEEFFSAKRVEVDDEMDTKQFESYLEKQRVSEESKVFPFIVSKAVLESGESIKVKFTFMANALKDEELTVEEKRELNKNMENDSSYEIPSKKVECDFINVEIKAEAKDLGTVLSSKIDEIKVTESEIKVTESFDPYGGVLAPTAKLVMYMKLVNQKDYAINDVTLAKVLPKELRYTEGQITTSEINTSLVGIGGTYSESENTVNWHFDELAAGESIGFMIILNQGQLDENINRVKVKTNTIVSTGDGMKFESIPLQINVGRPYLEITQDVSNNDKHYKDGEKCEYTFNIKNTGSVPAQEAEFKDMIPNGVRAASVSYKLNGKTHTENLKSNKEVKFNIDLDPAEEAEVKVIAIAGKLTTNEAVNAINDGTITINGIETRSNEVGYVIEPKENTVKEPNTIDPNANTNSNGTAKEQTYKISGLAWLDENRDGVRSSSEKKLSNLSVKLMDVDKNQIVDSKTTDSNGNYTFVNVKNGKYIVMIDYNTEKYRLTTLKKVGAASNANSDFVEVNINENGKTRVGAVTDTILVNGASVQSIDIGFVLADVFDLKIDKAISKVTVQSAKETSTQEYNNVKLAKTEIAAKNLVGTTVYVEYSITVTNIGDVKGYARKIVDYIPDGMTFNSALNANKNWYTGTDGNLYTEELAKKELAKGESATIKLVLTRQMTNENTDIVSNQVEIFEEYNAQGIEDTNSKTGNKAQGENDLSSADIAIMVKTGEELIYASVIMTTISLGIIVVFMVYTRIMTVKRKEIV